MSYSTAAIEFGTSKIVVLIGNGKSHGNFEVIGSGVCAYMGYHKRQWIDLNDLYKATVTAIRSAEIDAKVKIREIYVGVPGEFTEIEYYHNSVEIMSKDKKINEIDVESILDSISTSFQSHENKILHQYPISYVIDGKHETEEPIGLQGNSLQAEIAAIVSDNEFTSKIESILSNIGINVKRFISATLGQGLLYMSTEDREKTSILLDVGYQSTEISVFIRDGLVSKQTIPLGGANITSDIAIVLQLSMEQAEQLKRRYVFGLDIDSVSQGDAFDMVIKEGQQSRRISFFDVQKIIESRVEEIALIVKALLVKAGLDSTMQPIVYLSGGGIALLQGGKDFIAKCMDLPVKLLVSNKIGFDNAVMNSALGILEFALEDPSNQEKNKIKIIVLYIKKITYWFISKIKGV